jgi:uncharacterized BrkB/YihY/UPF0761 family membrane protein
MVLLVTISSYFVDQDRAGKEVVAYIERYVPTSTEMQHHIFNAIAGVVKARKHAGAIAFLILVWVALNVLPLSSVRQTAHGELQITIGGECR